MRGVAGRADLEVEAVVHELLVELAEPLVGLEHCRQDVLRLLGAGVGVRVAAEALLEGEFPLQEALVHNHLDQHLLEGVQQGEKWPVDLAELGPLLHAADLARLVFEDVDAL